MKKKRGPLLWAVSIQTVLWLSVFHHADSGGNTFDHGNNTYEFRLFGGRTQYEGRVEVRRNNGTWGTIGGHSWNSNYVAVVCRSIGFQPSAMLSPDFDLRHEPGPGAVHLRVRQCKGYEMSLLDCTHRGWDDKDYIDNHEYDIELKCLEDGGNDTYEYRLMGGNTPFEGRLEIRRNNGTWGTVMGYGWTSRHANIACRSLGFSADVLSPDLSSHFGRGTGPVHIRVHPCKGDEQTLFDCAHYGWDNSEYIDDHDNDIGLHCLPGNTSLTLRLVPTRNNYTGLLEIFDGVSSWGSICASNRWGIEEADAACRYLGYSSGISAFRTDVGLNYVANINDIFCNPGLSLPQCILYAWHAPLYRRCWQNDVAGVVCSDLETVDFAQSEIRLSGGNSSYKGLVQMKPNNKHEWRTVCFSSRTQIMVSVDTIGFTLCSTISGYGAHAIGEFLDECSMASFASNVSRTVVVGRVQAVFDDVSGRDVAEFGNVFLDDATCSEYGYQSLFLTCTHEVASTFFGEADVLLTAESSCQGRCGYQTDATRCRCDPDCKLFQDCCFDYHICNYSSTVENDVATIDATRYSCVPLDRENPMFGSVMLVSKCAENWSNDEINQRCQRLPSLYADQAERLQAEWPVADVNGNNFQNLFCAICNGKDVNTFQPWDVNYPTISPYSDGNWRSAENCGNATRELGRVGKRLRHCLIPLISSCPPSTANEFTSTMCESYTNYVCVLGKKYRNYHCALCNDGDVANLTPCLGTVTHNAAILQRFWEFKAQTREDIALPCISENAIYDPFTERCRSISCPPGFQLNNQIECTESPIKSNISNMCCLHQLSWLSLASESVRSQDEYDGELNDETLAQFLRHISTLTQNDISKWKKSRNFGANISRHLFHSKSSCNIAGALDDTLQHSKDFVNDLYVAYTYICSNVESNHICAETWYSGMESEFKLVPFFDETNEILFHKGQYIMPTFMVHYIIYEYDDILSTITKDETVQVCGKLIHIHPCPSITLSKDNYSIRWSENGSRVIHFGGKSYEEEEYVMHPDGRIRLCTEDLTTFENTFFGYSDHLATANIIGSSVSLFGLSVAFALHCRFKGLRNFHGRCIMLLCILLFLAQLLPTLSTIIPFPHGLCVLSALVSHYSWLSAFAWMTVIAFNLFHIFWRGSLRRNKEWENGIFCRYVAPTFSLGLPLIVVILCLSLHFSSSSFSYGRNTLCWISTLSGNIWAFGVPAGMLLGINSVLFAVTVVLACRSQRRSRQMRMRKNTFSEVVKDLLLCIKIETCVGVTWTFGFAASLLDNETWWWIFVITNSLQGVFILLTTLLSSKARANFNGKPTRVQQIDHLK